ncbi:MAG: hypothetical protein P8Y13_12310 [Deinococcales bacterium]
MPRYAQFAYLLERVGSWPIQDLGDLMVEIRRDDELADEERQQLLERLYGVLWARAQEELTAMPSRER